MRVGRLMGARPQDVRREAGVLPSGNDYRWVMLILGQPLRRLRQNPRLIDALVSAGLLAVMLLAIATRAAQPGQQPNNAITYVTAVTMALPYAFHRRFPLAAVAVMLASLLIFSYGAFASFPGLNAFVMLFGVALHSERRRRSVIAFAAIMLVMTWAVLIQPPGIVDQATWISSELAVIVFWLGGENLRHRRARWAALRERNESLEREREERARQAVVEERLRIARELHDVVAHAMSVIAVQSGVGNHVIDTQPAEAKKALAAIETTSRSALTEMRRLLGVLRQDGESDAELVPAPGLRDIPDLIRVRTGPQRRGHPSPSPCLRNRSTDKAFHPLAGHPVPRPGGGRHDLRARYRPARRSLPRTPAGPA